MKNKLFFVLLIITLIGGFFRFWKLADYPVSLSIDEVGIGYNAYSILKTGRDEFGIRFPIAFRSVGDYKSPLLVYMMTPAISFFGLNEFGERFTLAFLGTLSIILVYLIIYELLGIVELGILGAFSMAISPWHTFFSRFSHDSILGLFFILLAAWIFLFSVNRKTKYLWLSGVCFGLSLFAYHAEKIFTPLIVLALLFTFKDKLLKYRGSAIKFIIIFGLFLAPAGINMLRPEGKTRAQMTFLTQDENIAYILHSSTEKLTVLEKILDNNILLTGNFWIKRYLNYWDPGFLFFKGMTFTKPGLPDTGLFYFFELPFFLLGLRALFFTDFIKDKKIKILIFLWLLIGPLAASFANNDQHASRSITTIPMPQLIISLGGYQLLTYIKKWNLKRKIIVAFAGLVIVITNIIYVGNLFFVHYPIQLSENWDYGYKEAALYAIAHQKEYNNIVIDNTFGTLGPYIVGTPHLYVLFYGKYDPVMTQKDRSNFGNDFANFKFRTIDWREDRITKNNLYIGSPWRLPLQDLKEEQIIKRIYFKNGQLGFLIVKT